MSIVTKTGDQGQTALMYNRRVSKCHPRVDAYGVVDELNAALGLARATARDSFVKDTLLLVQKDLVVLMGELATAVEDLPRFLKDGYCQVSNGMTAKLETMVAKVEGNKPPFHGWATPGGNISGGTLDVARTVCRRAERSVCALQEQGLLHNTEIVIYLNRLSDLLWLMARKEENGSDSTKGV